MYRTFKFSKSPVNSFPSDTRPFYACRGIPKNSEPNHRREKNYFLLFLPFRFLALGASTVSSPSVSTFTLRFFFDFPSDGSAAGFGAAFGLTALTSACTQERIYQSGGEQGGTIPVSSLHRVTSWLSWTSSLDKSTNFCRKLVFCCLENVFQNPLMRVHVRVWVLGYTFLGVLHQQCLRSICMGLEGKDLWPQALLRNS